MNYISKRKEAEFDKNTKFTKTIDGLIAKPKKTFIKISRRMIPRVTKIKPKENTTAEVYVNEGASTTPNKVHNKNVFVDIHKSIINRGGMLQQVSIIKIN